MRASNRTIRITYHITVFILLVLLLVPFIPKTKTYAPYRRSLVLAVSAKLKQDMVLIDGQLRLVPHRESRKEFEFIKCRRVFEIGLFTKKEIDPECEDTNG